MSTQHCFSWNALGILVVRPYINVITILTDLRTIGAAQIPKGENLLFLSQINYKRSVGLVPTSHCMHGGHGMQSDGASGGSKQDFSSFSSFFFPAFFV
jgi:hypothetical protein